MWKQPSTTEEWEAGVGVGWKGIVRPLIEYALLHDLQILQVKEKFGGLRFYAVFDPTLDEMIQDAEAESYRVCENCGSQDGVVARGQAGGKYGWIKTFCGKCHSARDTSYGSGG